MKSVLQSLRNHAQSAAAAARDAIGGSPAGRAPRADVDTVRRDAEALADDLPALMLEAESLANSLTAGVHGRRRAGPGESFWQHRPYAFGDAVSSIDWRQSARASGRLYVRQNEWEAAAAAWIWRDSSASLDYASTADIPAKRRRADVLATALAIALAASGERVGHLGGRARPFHGRAAPAMFLASLAAGETDDAPPAVRLGRGSSVVLISDFMLSDSAFRALSAAAQRYAAEGAVGALLQVVDPAEETFPFSGSTEFEDLDSAGRLAFGDAGALGTAYRARLAEMRAAFANLAEGLGWTFHIHRTDAPAAPALLALHAALTAPRRRGVA